MSDLPQMNHPVVINADVVNVYQGNSQPKQPEIPPMIMDILNNTRLGLLQLARRVEPRLQLFEKTLGENESISSELVWSFLEQKLDLLQRSTKGDCSAELMSEYALDSLCALVGIMHNSGCLDGMPHA